MTSFIMISPVMASLVEEINRQLEIIEDSINRNNLPNSTLLNTKNGLDKVIEGLSVNMVQVVVLVIYVV